MIRIIAGVFATWMLVCMQPVQAQDAAFLNGRYATLQEQLRNNPFKRPIYIESNQTSETLQGDIYAVIEQPYLITRVALQDIHHWCDILILHINVKQCGSAYKKSGNTLNISIGRKFDQALSDTFQFDFIYKVKSSTPDYLQVMLDADDGPFGTSQYHIVIEVVDLGTQHSFLHFSYAYGYGVVARAAMTSYLATIGRNKVGFSRVTQNNNQPVYISGMRGVIERNTMRYYLAIESYLGALSVPVAEQQAKRLNDWQSGVEDYARQLHELDRGEYLAMKDREIIRQQARYAR